MYLSEDNCRRGRWSYQQKDVVKGTKEGIKMRSDN